MIYKKLAGDTRSQYQAAGDNKDMLLDYQANSAKRTQFIVSECDCFNMDDNEWLTLEEREAMKEEERVAAGEAHVKAGQKDYL